MEITTEEFERVIAVAVACYAVDQSVTVRGAVMVALDELNIKIKEPWVDGDMIEVPHENPLEEDARRDKVRYVRRGDLWREIPRSGEDPLNRVFIDDRADEFIAKGLMRKVEFG